MQTKHSPTIDGKYLLLRVIVAWVLAGDRVVERRKKSFCVAQAEPLWLAKLN